MKKVLLFCICFVLASSAFAANWKEIGENLYIDSETNSVVAIIKPLNWTAYMQGVEKKLKSNWNPPADVSRKTVALFKVAKDGKLLGITIIESSGSKAHDDAAKKAINLSAPFEPLPQEFKKDSVDIEFTFDYKSRIINQLK